MNLTPTTSFDEESGAEGPHPPKPEQPIIKDYAGVVVEDVNKQPTNVNKEPKNTNRRLMFAMMLLVGLGVVAIAIPIVKNNQRSSSANASAAGGDDWTTIAQVPPIPSNDKDEDPYILVTEVPPAPFEPLWNVSSDSISFYDESILQGYADTADLQSDLTVVAKMLVNSVAERSTGQAWLESSYNYNNYGHTDDSVSWSGTAVPMAMSDDWAMSEEEAVEEAMPVFSAQAMSAVGKAVKNDFAANIQEEKVEEGDKMVSDGTRVFAAYGDSIVVWDIATGKQLAMERIETFWPKEKTESSASTNNNNSNNNNGEMQGDDALYYYEEPKPTITSLLLVDSRLIVAVDGGYYYPMEPVAPEEERILSNHGQARVMIYETASLTVDPNDGEAVLGSMERVFSRDYDGMIAAFRVIGDNLHLVTSSQINVASALQAPIERHSLEQSLTDQEYIDIVKSKAETKLIPNFVEKLTKELTLQDGTLPKLARISNFLTRSSSSETDQVNLAENGLINSVTLVHSMNIADPTTMESSTSSPPSGLFLPSYSPQVYSSQDYLILAGVGRDPSSNDMAASTDATYLMAMKLNGAASTPHSIGKVKGTFLNQRSFDVVGNVLRVAHTIQSFDGTATTTSSSTLDEEPSTTENYITTLKLPDNNDENPGTMQELGHIRLGKANETFTTVRFYDNVAYAVTFLYLDPFYVINVTDASNLQVLAEVNITGFSSYLHSINDENNMIVAIGQEMDELGTTTLGLQLSLFDVRDVNNVNVSRHVIESDLNVYSDTVASWDVMAVRFNRETGRLIIPLDTSSCEYPPPIPNFHGFRMYSVTGENGIQEDEQCRVSMTGPAVVNTTTTTTGSGSSSEPCYSCYANLNPRAMIVNGNMMLTKDHFVKSVSMDDCATQWEFAVTDPSHDASQGCCGVSY